MGARVFLTCFSGNTFRRWSRYQLDDAQALDWWAIFVGHNAYSRGGVVLHNKETSLITLRCFITLNLEQSFDSTIYIMIRTETRDVLSIAPYLADTVPCTTHLIVQDGVVLTTPGTEKKTVLALLTSFVVSSSNIVLWDIAFGATKSRYLTED